MLWELIFLLVGAGAATIIRMLIDRKNIAVRIIKSAQKNKQPVIFLESKDATWMTRLIHRHHNLGVTEQKELVILSQNSMKYCSQLGCYIAHGDMYRSILVPSDVMKYKNELKEKYGLSDDEIGTFLRDVETKNIDALKDKTISEKNNLEKKDNLYTLYITMPSVVSSFIHTGVCRTSIVMMLRNLVEQRELENIGKKQWQLVSIGICVFLILLALGKFVLPVLFPSGVGTAAPYLPSTSTIPRIGG